MIRRHIFGLVAVAAGLATQPAIARDPRIDPEPTVRPAGSCRADTTTPVTSRNRPATESQGHDARKPTSLSLLLVGGAALLASQGARRRPR